MKAALIFDLLQIVGAGFLIYFSGRRILRFWRRNRSERARPQRPSQ